MAAEPSDQPSRFKPMTLALAFFVAALAAVFPLLDESYRPFNFAAFGAIGLFVAARYGILPALIMSLGSKLAADLLNYEHHGQNTAYLPSPAIYLCYAFYPLLGWALLRRSESPVRIGVTAILGGIPFFLITNFLSWQSKSLPYPDTFAGLMESYWRGLPFHRGTLISDVVFTEMLFVVHAVLSHAYFPAERAVLQPEVVR